MRGAILGIDPAVTATAVVCLPSCWRGNWSTVHSAVFRCDKSRGDSEAARIHALNDVACDVAHWADMHGVSDAWIEGYGFSKGNAHARTLGELGGLLRWRLLELGINIHVANMGSARKLLLGKIPRGKGAAKAAAHAALHAAGARFSTFDEVDAFVCANWGMSESGRYTLAQVSP